MKNLKVILSSLVLAFSVLMVGQASAAAMKVTDLIYAHDTLYSTIVTDAGFSSVTDMAETTDPLYIFPGIEGQHPVTDAAPGDTNYNGGRWSVMVVVVIDAALMPDVEITNAEVLLELEAMGAVSITPAGVFFECPLLPRK